MLKWFKKALLGDSASAAAPVTQQSTTMTTTGGSLGASSGLEPRRQRRPPSSGIAFDPELIERLKGDHRVLLSTYGAISTAAQAERWTEVESLLAQFRSGLTDHLMLESIKLYVYLQRTLASDPDNLRLMRRFSSEMVGIGKVVMDFVDDNQAISTDPGQQAQFLKSWRDIGKTLGDRVGREEKTLYPMYEAGEEADITG